MKTWLVGALMLLSPSAFAQQQAARNSLRLGPEPSEASARHDFGEASGVAVNSKGHIFVYNRGGSSRGPAFANTVLAIARIRS